MKKASIHVLVVEELTDLMYELNDVCNLMREVKVKHQEHLEERIVRAVAYTAHAIEYYSTTRRAREVIDDTIKPIEQDGYVDKRDLEYSIENAKTHIERINMAYSPELKNANLLKVILLYLTDTNFYIYGEQQHLISNRGDMRLAKESATV